MANIYGKFPTGYQETITGTRQADTIYPLGGSDQIDGGWGEDSVVISADASSFTIVTVSGTVYVDSVMSLNSWRVFRAMSMRSSGQPGAC